MFVNIIDKSAGVQNPGLPPFSIFLQSSREKKNSNTLVVVEVQVVQR